MLSYITFHPVTDKNLKSSESETQWEIMKLKELASYPRSCSGSEYNKSNDTPKSNEKNLPK